jgi:thymidylate synthase
MCQNYIEEKNLSIAWAKAFLSTLDAAGGEISPLMVKVTGFNNGVVLEDKNIRELINGNTTLKLRYKLSKDYVETIAGTIFPQSLWNAKRERQLLYDRYSKTYPKMKQARANYNGMYFQRLIAFENGDEYPINQLEHIIATWEKDVHRRSALQASIFDPRKDHTFQKQRGFPCLQQIAFTPLGTNGSKGLRITGFYAKQLLFEKAYGNYLGLCRLGQFMAKEMGIELNEMVCIASVARYADRFAKQEIESIKQELRLLIETT